MISASTKSEYNSLDQVREDIDQIDHNIVKLLGQRTQCVKAAARFKKSEKDVAAPERFVAMLAARREWAESIGVDPDMIEELYRNLVNRFIEAEKKEWRSR